MRIHHVVLLTLVAPIIAVGAVMWFLLPGSTGGLSFTPSAFDREAILRPLYWSNHTAIIHGYLQQPTCNRHGCGEMIISDGPPSPGTSPRALDNLHSVILSSQGESGWHALLRRFIPGMAVPIGPHTAGRSITIAGRLSTDFEPGQIPVFRPNST